VIYNYNQEAEAQKCHLDCKTSWYAVKYIAENSI